MRNTSLVRRIRCVAGSLLVGASLACGDSGSGPNGGQWWEGTWTAVRANNAAMPFRSDRGVVVRDLVVTLRADTTQPSTFYSAGTIFTSVQGTVDNTSTRTVKVTPANENVSIYAPPTSSIGQLQITLTRKSDTLVVPSYAGAEFKLIRR
jgi:hypothetical protein